MPRAQLIPGLMGWRSSNIWYLASGIPLANCVAAYSAKGAASLAGSYINLANPGTYNLTTTSAPTFDASTGWTFNGTANFLATGIVPNSKNWTYIVAFTDASLITTDRCLIGVFGTNLCVAMYPALGADNQHYAYTSDAGAVASIYCRTAYGVMAKTNLKLFLDGYSDRAIADSAPGANTTQVLIGDLSAGAHQYYSGKIQRVAIYNTTLTDTQILAVSRAMVASSRDMLKNNYTITDSSPTGVNGTGYMISAGGASGRAKFNGLNSFARVYSAGLAAVFNGLEGTLMMRTKVNSATDWTDGVQRDPIRFDGIEERSIVAFDRVAGANEIRCYYQSDTGKYFGVTTTDINGTLDWFTAAVTWSRSNTRVRGYVNGAQQGADVNLTEDWVGTLSTNCVLGAAHEGTVTPPDYFWGGSLGPVLLANREITPTEAANLNSDFSLANAQAILGANLIGFWELNES